jgi:hypothetical protein
VADERLALAYAASLQDVTDGNAHRHDGWQQPTERQSKKHLEVTIAVKMLNSYVKTSLK